MLAHDRARQLEATTGQTTRRFETAEQRLAELTDELHSTVFTLVQRLERMGERVDQVSTLVEQCHQRIDALEQDRKA